jgi:beta-lactamase superfamily II metal-dependent hydrolase
MRVFLPTLCLLFAPALPAAKNMEVYFIDVEGGQATLIVSPSGESMLVDTGWAGFDNRDANRIAAAAKRAGVKKIDYLVITHYHADHVGGVPQLAAKLPINNFVDHGPNNETGKQPDQLYGNYMETQQKFGKHLVVKPGDTIPVKGLNVKVLSANGDVIASPLEGAGQPNDYCASFQPKAEDKSENARSLGTLITFGKFRIIDLGDLTWNKEHALVCPNNKIGKVDVYLTTHHGMNISGPACIVDALHPRVAIMNNGARKGGTVEAWQTIHNSPGLEDIWQVHYAIAGGKENNAPDTFIANIDEQCEGKYIKLTVMPDGSFTVTNSRNNYSKTYKAS